MGDDLDQVRLGGDKTVTDYRAWVKQQDKAQISELVRVRLSERYVWPLTTTKEPTGFSMMAMACLLIETLESYKNGWENTKDSARSRSAFCFFFDSEIEFDSFRGRARGFYRNVRCGLLHQGETTGGWRIHLAGDLFVPERLTVNGRKFLEAVDRAISRYSETLTHEDWNGELWKACRKKFDNVIANCKVA